jgi:periplasmic divalent cation tolerance protein
MEKMLLVYMTAATNSEALAIANELLTQNLAACVNIIDQMHSIYKWDGELHYDKEVVLIAKTAETRFQELVEIVKTNHSYECPCIVALPIVDGNSDFMDWIIKTVR